MSRTRRRRLTPSSLLVIRILLVADALIVIVVGGIAAAFVERPAGVLFAAASWVVSGAMFVCVPLTDPYRRERRGERRGEGD